jgi:hypothetical protein
MSSSIHHVLRKWSREANWPYLGSVLVINKNIPKFETTQHDYMWLLEVTKDRRCKEIKPSVIRYVNGENLSLNMDYRLEDWNIVLNVMREDNNKDGMKRLSATRAKYYYKTGNYNQARVYFLFSRWNLKNIAYFITSYFPKIARWVVKKYNVFG